MTGLQALKATALEAMKTEGTDATITLDGLLRIIATLELKGLK